MSVQTPATTHQQYESPAARVRAFALAFDAPTPTVAYAVPSALFWVVATAVLVSVFAGDLLFVNGSVATRGAGPNPVVVVCLALALAVVNGFALTAATAALIARADCERLTAWDAWRGALHRPGCVALASGAVFLGLGLGVLFIVLTALQPVGGIAAILIALASGIVLAPALLAWPLLVAGRHSLGAALEVAWSSPRVFVPASAEQLGGPRVALTATFLGAGAVTVALSWLAGLLPIGWWTPVVAVAIALVPASVTQLLLIAAAVRGAAIRLKEPFAATRASNPQVPPRTRGVGVLVGVAVLLVPAVLAGLLAVANPWRIPSYTVADTHRVWRAAQIVPWEGGSLVLSRIGGEDARAQVCDGATCGPERDLPTILPAAVASAADGGVLSASWYPVQAADARDGRFELRVTHSSADELSQWWEPLPEDEGDQRVAFPGEERVLGSVDTTYEGIDSVFTRSNQSLMVVAVDTSGPVPVIASVVRPEGGQAVLALDFCADAACSSSTRAELPADWALGIPNATTLDVVAARDGASATVTLAEDATDEHGDQVRVVTVERDGASTSEVLAANVSVEDEPTSFGNWSDGAQVLRGADGLPVILSRAGEESGLRLFTCTDATCGAATVTDIETDAILLHSPALAIDDSGRPLIGLVDGPGIITLLSCLDAACTDRTQVELAQTVPTIAGFTDSYALSVDGDGRPLIAVGARRESATARASYSGTIITCAAARCGAE